MKCPVYCDLVGIPYNGHAGHIPYLSLNEEIHLIREPENEYDANAIRAVTREGDSLGYVNKKLAPRRFMWVTQNQGFLR
jgi:hypothetical protein